MTADLHMPRAPDFVGRVRELDELTLAVDRLVAGRGSLFLVSGEAGIGKTRLADQVASAAAERGAATAWGRCWEAGGAPPYWPWIEVLRPLVAAIDDEPGLEHALSAVSRLLRPVTPGGHTTLADDDGERARFELFDAVTSLLAHASRHRPLVCVLDDLHAADESSLLLLRFASRQLPQTPLLVIGTYREAEAKFDLRVDAQLSELARQGTRLALRGLSRDEVGDLLGRAHADAVDRVHQLTEGNPLFAAEVGRILAAGDGGSERRGIPVPDSAKVAFRRRVGGLSADASAVVSAAAVIGRDFDLPLLARVHGATPATLVGELEEAVSLGIVERTSVGQDFRFTHALLRETVYDGLPTDARARLHLSVGEALETGPADLRSLAEIAHHFLHAIPVVHAERAVDYALRAGRAAMQQFAYAEAARSFEAGRRVLETLPGRDERVRGELLVLDGQARWRAGDADSARASLRTAADVARELRSPDLLARAAFGLGTPFVQAFGRTDATLAALLGEALRTLPEGDTPHRPLLMTRLAVELYWSAEDADARDATIRDTIADALDIARRMEDDSVLASVLMSRHFLMWTPDNLDDRIADASEVVRLAGLAADNELLLQGLLVRLHDRVEAGEVRRADEDLAEYVRVAEQVGQPYYATAASFAQGMRAQMAGRLDEAEALATRGLELGQGVAFENVVQGYGAMLALLRREQGRLHELEPSLQMFLQQFPSVPEWRAVNCAFHAELGRQAEARAAFEEAAADDFAGFRRDFGWLIVLSLLAESAAFLGDGVRAARLYDLLRPYAGRHVVVAPAAAYYGPVSYYLGLLASVNGRWDDADAHFTEAATESLRMGAPSFAAHVERAHAAALQGRGRGSDLDRATALARHARDAYRRLGMDSFERKATSLLQAEPSGNATPTFRREGEYWTIGFGARLFRLRTTLGLQYVAVLLAHADEEVHCLELVAVAGGSTEPTGRGGGRQEILDAEARREYRRRLDELREELDESEAWGDVGRAERAREEIEAITRELTAAIGLGGRSRLATDEAERARKAVTNRIRAAISRISREDGALGRHLSSSVRTGAFCSYAPEQPVVWSL